MDKTKRSLFFCFPLANCLIHCQPDVAMWKCSQRLWKDQDASKSTVAPSGGFITIMTWQAEEYTAGLLSLQGGCCSWTPSPCHFISTSTCLHQLWKIVGYLDFSCLANPDMPQRVCKNPWKSLKQPALCSFFCPFLSQWSEGESRICCGQLLFVLIDLISQHSPGSGPYYLSWLWDTLFCSTCFNVASATKLCLFLVYLIVTCWNIGGDLIPEVEGHEMGETGSMVDGTSCL